MPASDDDFRDMYENYYGTDAGWESAYSGYSQIPYDEIDPTRQAELDRMADFLLITDSTGIGPDAWKDYMQEYFDMYGGEMEDFPWDEWREMYEALNG